MDMTALLKTFDITSDSAGTLPVYSPIDGAQIATLKEHSAADVAKATAAAQDAFMQWRAIPAPVRGEFVRLLGEELRENLQLHLNALATICARCGIRSALSELLVRLTFLWLYGHGTPLLRLCAVMRCSGNHRKKLL